MYKWGNKILNIYRYTYNPPHATAKRTVIEIIPSPDNLDPNEIIQQGGKSGSQWSMSGFTKTFADYQALLDDYLNSVEKTYAGHDGFTANAIIWELSEPSRINHNKFEYSIVFREV